MTQITARGRRTDVRTYYIHCNNIIMIHCQHDDNVASAATVTKNNYNNDNRKKRKKKSKESEPRTRARATKMEWKKKTRRRSAENCENTFGETVGAGVGKNGPKCSASAYRSVVAQSSGNDNAARNERAVPLVAVFRRILNTDSNSNTIITVLIVIILSNSPRS